MKDTQTIITSSFTTLVKELAQKISDGYTPVLEGQDAPYHQLLGNFIVVVEKAEKAPRTNETPKPVGQDGVVSENVTGEAVEAPKRGRGKTGGK